MKAVEVFTTNVQEVSQANYLMTIIVKIFPDYSVNFDLEDRDELVVPKEVEKSAAAEGSSRHVC